MESENSSGAFIAKRKWEKFNNPKQNRRNNEKFEKYEKSAKSKVKCFRCQKLGHKSTQCRTNLNKFEHDSLRTEDTYLTETELQLNALHIKNELKSNWCLDSGCTTHLCSDKEKFVNITSVAKKKVNLANDASADATATGTVKMSTGNDAHKRAINLTNVLYVPSLRTNLMSVAKITDKGDEIVFRKNNAIIKGSNGQIKFTACRQGDLYFIEEKNEQANGASIQNKDLQMRLWHNRLGHLNAKDMMELSKRKLIPRADSASVDCNICLRGKLTALPFTRRASSSTQKLEIVHTDLCGPMRTESLGKAKYLVTFIDDCTRWCEVRFLLKKSDLLSAFKAYKSFVEKQTGMKIKSLQSDNGKEYCNKEFNAFLTEQGIQRRLTAPYIPQQNGVAERKNRTLIEMARCMMLQSKLAPSFWAEAVATANFIRNRCTTKSLDGKIPFEEWTGKRLTLKFLKTFGSEVYILDKSPSKDKFEPRGKSGIFIGYSNEAKAFRIWIPQEKKVVVTRDVKFPNELTSERKLENTTLSKTINDNKIEASDTKCEKEYQNWIDTNQNFNFPDDEEEKEGPSQIEKERETIHEEEALPPEIKYKRGPGRPRKIITGKRGRPKLAYNEIPSSGCSSQIEEFAEREETHENSSDTDDDVFYDIPDIPEANVTEINLKEALGSPCSNEWKEAIYSEIKSLIKNETWEIVERPSNKNIVGCRLVLTNKYNPDGTLERRKARLVAKGYSQKPGMDFKETFAPVARLNSLRLIVALAAKYNLQLHQLDVETAFLNGDIEEEVFMNKPDLLEDMLKDIIRREHKNSILISKATEMLNKLRKNDPVCRLKKAIYGLKQAGRQWYLKLNQKLLSLGLSPTQADPCVYKGRRKYDIMIVLTYVDDIIIACKNQNWINEIKQEIKQEFKTRDMGLAKCCLGIQINQQKDRIVLSQERYANELLIEFGMNDANPVSTPMEAGVQLVKGQNDKKDQNLPYRELIGSLMYLAIGTRPDLAHSVSVLSQFNDCHTKDHWVAAKRVLRYIKGTTNMSLVFRKEDQNNLVGYIDANWGSCLLDRRSYTGYAFLLSGSAISWESRKQRTVALSTTEAEYMAISEGVKEAIHLQKYLKELGFENLNQATLFNDNRGANLLARNSVFHQRSKHIDIRYHFVREVLKNENVNLEYLKTEEMIADVLTKALQRSKHFKCINSLGMS